MAKKTSKKSNRAIPVDVPYKPTMTIKAAQAKGQNMKVGKPATFTVKGRVIEESINTTTENGEGSKQSYSNHLADLGTDYMEKEKIFYYASQEGHYLKSLDQALERMKRGTYGKCQECGCLISEKRLEVVPGAKHCIECKSKNEKQRGR